MKHITNIHLIADYGTGDGAFSEVTQKLLLLDQSIHVIPLSVPPFSTLSTGFWTYQLATVNPIPNMCIFTNTAPRKDNKKIRIHNEGERLVVARLKNTCTIIGVNAGFCFSFIKPLINTLHAVNVANKGSQFRSRDFYPEAVVGIIHKKKSFIGDNISAASLPTVPEKRIAWIDGYGNMKTTMRASHVQLKPGQPILISLHGMKRTAYFTNGSFSVREGELAFAPGSCGGNDKFMELFLRGLSAWHEFGKPPVESEFSVQL